MGGKFFLSVIFILFTISSLLLYWFIPFGENEFIAVSPTSNFNISNNTPLQFYPNMRFVSPQISYRIDECAMQKKEDMKNAFDLLSEKTLLTFYPVSTNEAITITCEDKAKLQEGLFIAGEGGPTNITIAGNYHIITKGNILLIRPSSCPMPNIALHELLHVLGFDHSGNPKDIMYPVSECDQTISEEVLNSINALYAIPSYPDLFINNVSAVMRGNYLDVNLSIRNDGFSIADKSQVVISTGKDIIKTIDLETISYGTGRGLALTNIWVGKRDVKQIVLEVKTSFDELDKTNNLVLLNLKEE